MMREEDEATPPMDNSNPVIFFKIILSSALEDGKLKFPNSFTKKYGDGLSNPVFLKPPDGTEWKVNWTKDDDDGIFLEHGWDEFAIYYNLDHGHLMFFEYKNTSEFEVLICETSGLEIDYPFNVIQQENERIKNMVDQVFDDMPQSQNNRMKSPTSYPQLYLPLLDQINSNECQGTSFDKSTFASIKKELDEDIGGSTPCPRVEQLRETLNKATTSKSRRNPFFMVILKPSYANSYSLNIPSRFTRKYLRKQAKTVILQVHDQGRTWPVAYSVGKFNSGWKTFAKDNNLNVGDHCVFELTNPKGLYFKVSISRIGEETLPLSQVEGDRVNCLDPLDYAESESDIVVKAVKKKTKRTSMAIHRDFQPDEETLKEAKKFTSENPFFMVIVKPSFLGERRPCIPLFLVKNYLQKTHLVTFKFGGRAWHLKFLHYAKYKTAVKFSTGWGQFCRECELKARDICIFELINKEDAVFDVHLFRCQI
ncbi:hypothetical protein PIB30_046136 [Stylosanthes scabra]|uniref:TF-B3 domain-containing protein n=1 Tax=Stylosanthes scabra TaxID=79078 RepID=A0ABU6RGD2_9FABA|nr:hypothetical protein [Stylosanthes scabra]